MKEIFEWDRILYNDLPENFILEVLFRSTVMFIILLLTLKLAGKRGVKQLSVFETVIIIALGSAAGDPMFYEDVGIIPAGAVFLVIITLYRSVTWLTGKAKNLRNSLKEKQNALLLRENFLLLLLKKKVWRRMNFSLNFVLSQ